MNVQHPFSILVMMPFSTLEHIIFTFLLWFVIYQLLLFCLLIVDEIDLSYTYVGKFIEGASIYTTITRSSFYGFFASILWHNTLNHIVSNRGKM